MPQPAMQVSYLGYGIVYGGHPRVPLYMSHVLYRSTRYPTLLPDPTLPYPSYPTLAYPTSVALLFPPCVHAPLLIHQCTYYLRMHTTFSFYILYTLRFTYSLMTL